LVAGILIASFGVISFVSPLNPLNPFLAFSGPYLTITVKDAATGLGVPYATIYFFPDDGGVEPPENAYLTRVTDADGNLIITGLGFWRVGVIADGYTSDYSVDAYSHWGEVNIDGDITYSVELYSGESDVNPEPVISGFSSYLLTIAGAFVSCCGVGFIAVDKYVD